jgi:hypothetical protein
MINKKTEITASEISLFPIQGKNIDLSFSGDRISNDGGLLLLHELDSQLNLLSSARDCIHDERDQRYIYNSVEELLIQRVFQIASGYENCKKRYPPRYFYHVAVQHFKIRFYLFNFV